MDKIFAQAAGGKKAEPVSSPNAHGTANKEDNQNKMPKGVVIGEDGKPCRSCTKVSDWMKLAKTQSSKQKSSSTSTAGAAVAADATLASSSASEPDTVYPSDCPPDVDTLGNHTWTLLHSMSAQYPEQASSQQQSDMKQFLTLFGKLYPCWVCAGDFQDWMGKRGNEPKTEGRKVFGTWMCEAHNEVNRKLGKKEFDCAKWEERWRDGWKDGRCG